MKIFLLSRNNIVFYGILVLVLICSGAIRQNAYVDAVSTANRILPIYSVQTDEKCLAITFDSAWGDEDTQKILSVLEKNNAKATFFVTGDYLDRCGESAKAFFDAGHEIANHSDSHPHPNRLSDEKLLEDTEKCEQKIFALTAGSSKLYRAPYGEYNNRTVKTLTDAGYWFIQWDADSLDYKGLSAEEICERILGKVKNGSIVLFHTGTANTADALDMLLPKLSGEGYRFCTVGEMIYKTDYYIDHSGRQIKQN